MEICFIIFIKKKKCEKLVEETLSEFRNWKKYVSMKTLDTLCKIWDMQPGNIIEFVEE